MHFKCGYSTAVGLGFDALVHHLENKHGEKVSMKDEPQYTIWREFDFPLVLSGCGHKVSSKKANIFIY